MRVTTPIATRRAGRLGLALLYAVFGIAPAASFEVQRAEARFVEGEYHFDMIALLDAPIEPVQRILRDYDNYPTLDSRILDARVLERPESDVAILATTLRACFGPVCRTVKRVERVEEAEHALFALTDPTRSQMKSGETQVQLEASGHEQTRVIYATRLRPDFWIPAFVARRMMLTTLEEATVDLFRSVELQAQQEGSSQADELQDFDRR